ncbi:MAG TPA: hypothetical protein VFR09_06710 [Alphaproteobacteria bacterium]|nr:hypothetical protein [Alphaproteobacteria bacterium]
MREASYGFPPDKADEVVWLGAREFVALQGIDAKLWTVKPYCPHCKCVMELQDAKGTQGVHLESQPPEKKPEGTEFLARAVVGFKHPRNKALKDCPYSFLNDPRYAYPVGRNTAKRERQKNRIIVAEPVMAEALQEILRCLIQPVTKQKQISREDQSRLNRIGAGKVDGIQGLAEYPWLRPYMQALLFGFYRPKRDVATLPPPVAQSGELFADAGEQLCKSIKSHKQRDQMNERCWRPYGPLQKLHYTSVNGEERTFEVPSRLQLCFVFRRPLGVSYVAVRPKGKRVVFDVTRAWAVGIVKKYRKRQRKKALRAKVLNRAGLPERKSPTFKHNPKQAALL